MPAKRIAIVTGANRGIGFEIARRLGREGLVVVLGARGEASGWTAAETLRAEGLEAFAETIDVADPASIDHAVTAVATRHGALDVLVNNAAVYLDRGALASNVSFDVLRSALDTNLIGAWRACQAVIPLMRRADYGRIVNLTSAMGSHADLRASGGSSPSYRLTKAALNALTMLLASELRGTNILVNAVCPGWVRTDMGGSSAPRSVEQGADTPVWLALLPDGGPSGGLFQDRRPIDW